jgi:hypothetical protein
MAHAVYIPVSSARNVRVMLLSQDSSEFQSIFTCSKRSFRSSGKAVPCLTKRHAIRAHWGVEVQLHAFFDLGTRWR